MSRLGLQEADADDCVAQALERMLERPDATTIAEPYAYLKKAALNFGATLHRARSREIVMTVEALSPGADNDASQAWMWTTALVPEDWAVLAVEEAVTEIEADPEWAVVVVEAAMARLTIKQRTIVAHLARQDFDYARNDVDVRSASSAAALGMKPAAFRKAKQRAYELLASLIPIVIAELGVQPPARYVAAFEDRRGTFLADDEPG